MSTTLKVPPARPVRLEPLPDPATAPRPSPPRRWPVPVALGALILFALALRLLQVRGLWLDEAISVFQANLPFGEMIEHIRTQDRHPPLHHAILWLTVRVFGDGELAVRLPSIIAGTLVVPMVYAIGRRLYGLRTGLLAAAFVTVAPLLVWYSQEARMYSLLVLFAMVLVWAQLRAIDRGGFLDWLLYVVAGAAMLWTHYFAVLFLAVSQVAFAVAVWRRRRAGLPSKALLVGWLATAALIAWQLVPLLSFALDQYELTGAASGFDRPGGGIASDDERSVYSAVTGMVWSLWGYHSDAVVSTIASAWPLAVLLSLLLLGRGRSARTLVLLVAALLPFGALFVLGLVNPTLFEPRYYLIAIPLIMLLLARLVTSWTWSRFGGVIAGAAVLVSLAVGLADQQLNRDNPRLYDFRGAIEEIEERAGSDDALVLLEPRDMSYPLAYYAPQLEAQPLGRGLPPDAGSRHVFLLASFLEEEQSAERVGSAVFNLKKEGDLVDRFRTPQTRVYEFE